ncbi:MAG: site-specific DNA-methyltransferase, partial [Candidatus Lokiarchaeota archaeon]|nr:site-specific DNA-methyltransferase [Candidatus Lokiarchaeota archaeon]
MSDTIKPLAEEDGESKDLVAENVEKLKQIFPECVTDGKIDFEVLKEELGDFKQVSDERYSFTWNGKSQARKLAMSPSRGTLRPCPEESVNWENTEHLFIEGDNLEVLKLLQRSYHKKVKMIYIDPPYNTGKDFIYPDNYRNSINNYLSLTGQIDEDGKVISSNPETNGRYHTDWLNMIYPRLKVSRELLTDDGIIFISCNDNEIGNLRKVTDEVFGEENFIANLIWNSEGHTDNQYDVKVNHEYILTYAKNSSIAELGHVVDPNTREESNLWKGYAENSITKNGPGNPPSEVTLPAGFPVASEEIELASNEPGEEFYSEVKDIGYISRQLTDSFKISYPIRKDSMIARNGKLVEPCRVYSGWANVNKLKKFISNSCSRIIEESGDELEFYLSENGVIYYKRHRKRARNILSVLK